MAAGMEVGLDLPHVAVEGHFLSDIFLRLIKTITAPLIFGTLVTGIAGGDGEARLGRMAWKAVLLFELLTTAALALGLLAANLTHAGRGLVLPAGAAPPAAALPHWQEFLTRAFPENIASAVAANNVLEVAVFALLFALALRRVPPARRAPMLALLDSLTAVMFAFTNLVMYLAPLAVGSALAYTVAGAGAGALVSLGRLLVTHYAAILVFALGIMLPVALAARLPLRAFLQALAEPASIAFATATSEAALPRAIESLERFGVPRSVTGFVLPTGYSFNLTGSALYLALASVFVAQSAGIAMSWQKQAGMLLVLMLTSKGVAGVPRAVLVVLLATAGSFGLPEGPITVLLGIDALMDMGRTTLNVTGNCLAAAVVARWEGVLAVPESSRGASSSLSARRLR